MAAEKLSGRPCRCQEASEITSNYRQETSSCTVVHSTKQHVIKQEGYMKGNRTYADADKYGNDADQANDRRCSNHLYMK
jgi:hypothetical protein